MSHMAAQTSVIPTQNKGGMQMKALRSQLEMNPRPLSLDAIHWSVRQEGTEVRSLLSLCIVKILLASSETVATILKIWLGYIRLLPRQSWWSRTWRCLWLQSQGFKYWLCCWHPGKPWWVVMSAGLFQGCKTKLSASCPLPLLPVGTLCNPETKLLTEHANCLAFFPLHKTFYALKISSVTGAHISLQWCYFQRGKEPCTFQNRGFFFFWISWQIFFLSSVCMEMSSGQKASVLPVLPCILLVSITQKKLFLIKTGWAGMVPYSCSGHCAQVSGRWDWQSGDKLRISEVKQGISLPPIGYLHRKQQTSSLCSFYTPQILPGHGSSLPKRGVGNTRFLTLQQFLSL